MLTDEQGKLVEQRSYDAFGARRNPLWGKFPPASFSSLTTMGFTGHESDDELGLINMKGRMYDPKVGRFLTMDPVVSDPYSGQGWNPYSYVWNNPLTYVDPSGFSAVPVETSSPPPDCIDQGRLCGSSGKGIRPVEVTVHRPKSMQGPREDATQHGAAATPTDVGTAGTAVGVAPTPDPTATSSVWRHIGSFALGLGKGYVHQVLDTAKSLYLNIVTLGGYSIYKFTWTVGESVVEGVEKGIASGDPGWGVALRGTIGGINSVSPLWQIGVSAGNIKTAIEEGDYEKLGEAAEPVLAAIVASVVTGKLAGLEAGAAEASPPLPAYAGGKTSGILRTAAGDTPLVSGYKGPSAGMPRGTPGMNGNIKSHIEAHAASIMRQQGVQDATLYINRVPCPGARGCGAMLPRMLPEGSILRVIGPDGYDLIFKGLPD